MMRKTNSWQIQTTGVNTATMALCILLGMATAPAVAAQVVQRAPSAQAKAAPRANNAATRMPTITANAVSAANTSNQPAATSEPAEAAPTTTEPAADTPTAEPERYIIEDKSAQFDTTLTKMATSGATDASSNALAEMVARQRAALDAKDAASTANKAMASGQNSCDAGLRDCMAQKCGEDFTDCATDGDTLWGDKMDACRRDLPCTAQEYKLFTAEIKADRDMNVRLGSYNEILNCGNQYNNCIISECGTTFGKCLGKSAGDAAIAKCASIAKECTRADSGLAARAMEVFSVVRQDAEKQVAADEKRLYALRDEMKTQCQRLGAMFDERSLDCVFTINFYAGTSATPYASKKGYAGSTFDCTQNWFGIDITTFKENAYRYTREQTSATSAFMGAGLGTAVGAVSSGAIDRAIDRKKAEDAVKKAQKEHDETFNQNGEDKKDGEEKPGDGTDPNAQGGNSGSSQGGDNGGSGNGGDTGDNKPASESKIDLTKPGYAADNLQNKFDETNRKNNLTILLNGTT